MLVYGEWQRAGRRRVAKAVNRGSSAVGGRGAGSIVSLLLVAVMGRASSPFASTMYVRRSVFARAARTKTIRPSEVQRGDASLLGPPVSRRGEPELAFKT